MSIESKTRIYKTCVRPVLTYAAETRAATSRTKQTMKTTEMRALRSIIRVTLRDKIKSETIRETCGIQDVVRWARVRRRCWRDHVERMSNERIANMVMTQKPNTRRHLGRSPKRWKDSWTSQSQEGNE